jgi:quinol monooxygenase YgiN
LILVTGHFRVAPENVERLRPHARRTMEETRKEKGCILYAYGEDLGDPGLMRVVERWEDWPSLEAHLKAPHLMAWRAVLKEIGVLDREVTAHSTGEERAI